LWSSGDDAVEGGITASVELGDALFTGVIESKTRVRLTLCVSKRAVQGVVAAEPTPEATCASIVAWPARHGKAV
jgi:hypothetical protein